MASREPDSTVSRIPSSTKPTMEAKAMASWRKPWSTNFSWGGRRLSSNRSVVSEAAIDR